MGKRRGCLPAAESCSDSRLTMVGGKNLKPQKREKFRVAIKRNALRKGRGRMGGGEVLSGDSSCGSGGARQIHQRQGKTNVLVGNSDTKPKGKWDPGRFGSKVRPLGKSKM